LGALGYGADPFAKLEEEKQNNILARPIRLSDQVYEYYNTLRQMTLFYPEM